MLKKIILLIVLFIVLSSAAWALTYHTDYATGMEIKYCNDCHISNNVAPNHLSFWVKEHRLSAEKHPNNCKDCHQQSFCFDCHNGGGLDADMHSSTSGPDYMPKSHRSDFREIHPIKAREDERSCYRCHDAKRFCAECHSKFSSDALTSDSHRRQFRDIPLSSVGPNHASFTPADCKNCHVNGALPKHEWSLSHAREARRNLASCQTCHPDGDVCMKCHNAQQGLKVNPHPRNWGSVKGRFSRASDNRTCVKCHAPGTF